MATRTHSDLGASGMYRWKACPGSYRQGKQCVRRRASLYAATGTLAHEIIENIVSDPANVRAGIQVPRQMVGKTYTIEGHEVTVDEDLLDGINTMLGYLHDVSGSYPFMRTEMSVCVDYWLIVNGLTPPEPMFATADIVLLDPFKNRLEIVDYKNGSGIFVAIQDNPQLLYYAAGVLAYLKTQQKKVEVEQIRITVVQPHASGHDKIRSQDFDIIDVMMWIEDVLVPAVRAAADPDAPLNPGDYCRYCPATHGCPALIASAVAMAKKDFKDHILPDDPAELADKLVMAERAVAWADALRTYAIEQLQRQVRIPGWGLEPTRPTRRWVSESQVEAALVQMGVAHAASHQTKLLSPAQMEKQLKRKFMFGWEHEIAPLIESKSSGWKLTRTDTTDATKDFMDGDE